MLIYLSGCAFDADVSTLPCPTRWWLDLGVSSCGNPGGECGCNLLDCKAAHTVRLVQIEALEKQMQSMGTLRSLVREVQASLDRLAAGQSTLSADVEAHCSHSSVLLTQLQVSSSVAKDCCFESQVKNVCRPWPRCGLHLFLAPAAARDQASYAGADEQRAYQRCAARTAIWRRTVRGDNSVAWNRSAP